MSGNKLVSCFQPFPVVELGKYSLVAVSNWSESAAESEDINLTGLLI